VLAVDHTVCELCRRLDELPLALELAAARTVLFSPAQLLERLSQRLDLLKGSRDADPRQQTLRATIDWSHELLTPEEQRVYRALSVFAGGCTWEAAEKVAGADPDLLQSLLDKSLVRRRDTRHGPRFWMLETIRDHAHAELERAGEVATCESGLSAWLRGELELRADALLIVETEAIGWLAEEEPNLQVALWQAVDTGDRDALLALIASANSYWMSKSAYRQGSEWTSAAVRLTEGTNDRSRADALRRGAWFAAQLGRYDEAKAWLEEAVTVAQVYGDTLAEARALAGLGRLVAQTDPDPDRVAELFEQALKFEESNQVGERDRGITRYRYGISLMDCGDPDGALRELAEADRLFAGLGFIHGRTFTNAALGWVQILHGDVDTGLALSADALEGFLQADDLDGVSKGLQNIALGLARRGQIDEAALLVLVAERIDGEVGTAAPPAWQSEAAEIHRLIVSLPDADRDRVQAEAASISREEAARVAITLCRSLK
jgi:non-specific serine/threonine protein kinase